jgi:hypothetical protein
MIIRIKRGTSSNLTTNPVPYELRYTTDTKQLYIYDGSSFVNLTNTLKVREIQQTLSAGSSLNITLNQHTARAITLMEMNSGKFTYIMRVPYKGLMSLIFAGSSQTYGNYEIQCTISPDSDGNHTFRIYNRNSGTKTVLIFVEE